MYGRGWGDGLPVIPPTPERVERMLGALPGHAPQESLGQMPPRWGEATVEKLAINAVMAGCTPAAFPVVVAATRALLEPQLNLYAVQATTNPVAPLCVVNGPIAEELDINSGLGAFGQGWWANATIGRALRLVLLNVGGGRPGILDRATQGQPAKYTFCVAENEAESPWEPLHVERGLPQEQSAVTLLGVAGTLNILDLGSKDAEGILTMVAGSMTALGSNNMLLGGAPVVALCPEHAAILAREGLSKADVKRELFRRSQVPLGRFARENQALIASYREALLGHPGPATPVPVADRPEDIQVIVVGGAGPHSQFLPSFGGDSMPATRPVEV
ncbi:MAG: hypothetical protein HY330_05160 [Chloroflexi bacterium]|nr:hypothetical protein [Chloroflexota bacterium]